MKAEGTFEIKREVTPLCDPTEGVRWDRAQGHKQFFGGMTGESTVWMLSSQAEAGAGYVALEQVRADVSGKSGTFGLLHLGVMSKMSQELTVVVAPGSGTGDFAGLVGGRMEIRIEEGIHWYALALEF